MRPVCIFLPISRSEHLDMVFTGLEMLSCNASLTYLVTYVDGDDELYERVRRLTIGSKFNLKLCERRPYQPPTHNRVDRIARIAAIKNESRDLIPKGAAFVFGIEDDTVIPPHALQALLDDYAAHPQAGFIQGVQLGINKTDYVKAWVADSVREPSSFTSILPAGERLSEIHTGAFFCYLTPLRLYAAFDYRQYSGTPGVEAAFGMFLASNGYKNYIDWQVEAYRHLPGGPPLTMSSGSPAQTVVHKRNGKWH